LTAEDNKRPFDLIVSTWVFEHLPDPVHAVEKARDRLRSGGHMVLLFEVETPSWRGWFWNRIFRFICARLVPGEAPKRHLAESHHPPNGGDIGASTCPFREGSHMVKLVQRQ
jgi:SAM-dependent methyltransferase